MNIDITDNHTFYIKSQYATETQIKDVFNKALDEYKLTHDKDINCEFYINSIKGRNGETFGITFLYVSNSEVYNMICGNNPDGMKRMKSIKVKSVKVKAQKLNITDMKWGDISSSDDEDEVINNGSIEPLIIIPDIKLDNHKKINSVEKLDITPACIYKLEDKYIHNILKTKNVPKWITSDMIKKAFTPFASDSTTKSSRIFKGRKFMDTYPFININDDSICFVIFDKTTNDAQFALHLMKKHTITHGNLIHTLLFYHSYNLHIMKNNEIYPKKFNETNF
jgi:hypothetical protein